MTNSSQDLKENPFFKNFHHRFDAVPFDQISVDDYLTALTAAIDEARLNIEKIKSVGEPDFENTIVALETCSERVDTITSVYFNLFSAEASEEHQALAQTISPMVSAFSNDILLDQGLFDKVKAVYEKRDTLTVGGQALNEEQKMLLSKSYKSFTRNGALLDDEQKESLREIDQKLSQLSPQFSERVLKQTNAFQLVITDKSELEGLPDSSIDAAALTAKERGLSGWVFTLQAPSYVPFLKYSNQRPLREKLWRAYNSLGCGGEFDTRAILLEMVQLRQKRAQLLGYDTHADFVLEERMAQKPQTVLKFLDDLIEASHASALKDLDDVRALKKELSGDDSLQPWDFAFYSEKLKEQRFEFNEEELRAYFPLDKVIQGSFDHATALYDIEFSEVNDLPKYHDDVKTYEVRHKTSGDFIGLLYADFFPRSTKKNGAWMCNIVDQGLRGGKVDRPHVGVVCNLTQPTEETPSLLTLNEVRTVFHEFGHALHALLSQCTYPSLSGAHVYWDFVELPSQINENWILEKETLDRFASHYKTGELIPEDLARKIKDSSQFMAGYASIRQLCFATLDMAWHNQDVSSITSFEDVEKFEKKALKKLQLFEDQPGTSISCHFSHVFAGGYSAGYYSYKWAEVLDADAFEFFKEKGLYNKEVAQSFRENILERGGTAHPMELYKNFRGREPDPKALLRRDGLLSSGSSL